MPIRQAPIASDQAVVGIIDPARRKVRVFLLPSYPFAAAHERLGPAVLCDTIHIHPVGADHPVDMDQALVRSAGSKLVLAHGAAAVDALAVGLAERDVARCVLVEQSVEEEKAA